MEIDFLYQNMSNKAKSVGSAIMSLEQNMDEAFANKTMTIENRKLMLDKSADIYGQVRFVHLSAHLDTMQILTTEQIQMYNKMRGYDIINVQHSTTEDDSSHHRHSIR
jgi:hypothetical protein